MNSITPKVSIIIPVYNGSNFLREAIDSALAQTYENKEILVINDGSKDNGKTEEIALSYGEKIRYFSKENGGVSSALNMAIKEMTGEYFSWLSHDDLYYEDKVKRQIETLLNLGEEKFVIYSDCAVFTTDSSSVRPIKMEGVSPKNFRYWLTVKNCLNGCTLLIPKSAFEECGIFDETLVITQDYDLWFRIASKYRFVHIAEVLVKAREHPKQVAVRMSGLATREGNDLMIKFIKNLTIEECTAATKKTAVLTFNYIAQSMALRGFKGAQLLAQDIAKKDALSLDDKNPTSLNKKPCVRNFTRNILKMILPNFLFFALKNFLGKIGFIPTKFDYTDHTLKNKFTDIYDKHIFSGSESRSGAGSDLVQTRIVMGELPKIIKDFKIKTFFDAPCGDWYWMRHLNLDLERYIGCDIVESLIAQNRRNFANDKIHFELIDLSRDSLPKTDLIFSRDLLVHLNFEDAFKVIASFKKSGAKYLLTTTYPTREQNLNLILPESLWYPINLETAPFNFPKPILLVNEGCTEGDGNFTDKSLGLWLLKDIKLPPEWY